MFFSEIMKFIAHEAGIQVFLGGTCEHVFSMSL